jgi:hypothetical protein
VREAVRDALRRVGPPEAALEPAAVPATVEDGSADRS